MMSACRREKLRADAALQFTKGFDAHARELRGLVDGQAIAVIADQRSPVSRRKLAKKRVED